MDKTQSSHFIKHDENRIGLAGFSTYYFQMENQKPQWSCLNGSLPWIEDPCGEGDECSFWCKYYICVDSTFYVNVKTISLLTN